eukprot:14395479-Alexandrium_andersonii.AAC.1
MAARAKAFSKGPPLEPPAELDFFGRPVDDPRQRLVVEGAEPCSKCGKTVAYGCRLCGTA